MSFTALLFVSVFMNLLRAAFKFAAFLVLTLGIYSLWFIAPLLPDQNSRRKLREFIFRHWARGFIWLAGAKIKVEGSPPPPPFLLVANHLSYFDIAVFRSLVTGVFVAKADIADWFAAGTMIRNMGMIYINRENRRDVPRASAEIISAFKERREGVIIFAEGTTSNGKQVLPFKSSVLEFAAAQNWPVHYAAISYQTKGYDPPASEAVCWWREESGFATHLFEFFKLGEFECTIKFGAEPLHARDRKILARELQKAVAAEFEPVN